MSIGYSFYKLIHKNKNNLCSLYNYIINRLRNVRNIGSEIIIWPLKYKHTLECMFCTKFIKRIGLLQLQYKNIQEDISLVRIQKSNKEMLLIKEMYN